MKKIWFLSLVVSATFISCDSDTQEDVGEEINEEVQITSNDEQTELEEKMLKVNVNNLENSSVIGEITFIESNGEVTMSGNFEGFENDGPHAIHIHETGDCSAPDGKSAGGHWNPTNEAHGKWQTDTYHKGDIGNLEVTDGKASISRTTTEWCIGCEDETKNIVGKAIIIHEGPDDFSSQPSGAAGKRVACGAISF